MMTETLTITYLNCGFCTAKNHCAACGGELRVEPMADLFVVTVEFPLEEGEA